jgi:uncharacterized membrane protein
MADVSQAQPAGLVERYRGTVILCYALYLLGWPTLHIATMVALVLAYVERGEARGTLWESHFGNLIETFWIAVVVGIVAVALCFVFVGFPILFGLAVWVLYRTLKGLVRALEGRPYF